MAALVQNFTMLHDLVERAASHALPDLGKSLKRAVGIYLQLHATSYHALLGSQIINPFLAPIPMAEQSMNVSLVSRENAHGMCSRPSRGAVQPRIRNGA